MGDSKRHQSLCLVIAHQLNYIEWFYKRARLQSPVYWGDPRKNEVFAKGSGCLDPQRSRSAGPARKESASPTTGIRQHFESTEGCWHHQGAKSAGGTPDPPETAPVAHAHAQPPREPRLADVAPPLRPEGVAGVSCAQRPCGCLGDVVGSSRNFRRRSRRRGGSVWWGSGGVAPGAAGMAEPHAETRQSKTVWRARGSLDMLGRRERGAKLWRSWFRRLEARVVPARPGAALPTACYTVRPRPARISQGVTWKRVKPQGAFLDGPWGALDAGSDQSKLSKRWTDYSLMRTTEKGGGGEVYNI